MKTCRATMSAPRAFRCRPSLPKYPPLQGLNSTSQYLTLPSPHIFQPPDNPHSLALQRFTQVLPRQNPHYHYFHQSLLLQPLNQLLVLLYHLAQYLVAVPCNSVIDPNLDPSLLTRNIISKYNVTLNKDTPHILDLQIRYCMKQVVLPSTLSAGQFEVRWMPRTRICHHVMRLQVGKMRPKGP